MAAVFPGSVKTFSTKAPGEAIASSHINDLQAEVAAIETYLIDKAAIQTIFKAIYPIGSIYMSVVSTNPSSLFGGTWVAWGAGRVPVGRDSGDPDFDTSEETGGSKTHNHTLSNLGIAKAAVSTAGFLAADAVPNMGNWNSNRQINGTFSENTSAYSSGFGLKGVTDTVTELPPYIVCYMWKRTA